MTMDTKALLAEAEALKPQLLTDRRTLHRDPEVGPSLPRTAAYVTERLTALGYTPRPLAGGVVADITGEDTGRCVLLRADMDALRVREATGLDFQSENGAMHACGHDMHAAMLLGAAALLKRHQSDLKLSLIHISSSSALCWRPSAPCCTSPTTSPSSPCPAPCRDCGPS